MARFVALFGQSFRAAVNAPFVAAVDAALAAEDWSRLSRGLAKALRAAQSSEVVRASFVVAAEWAALSNDVTAFDRHRLAVQVGRTVLLACLSTHTARILCAAGCWPRWRSRRRGRVCVLVHRRRPRHCRPRGALGKSDPRFLSTMVSCTSLVLRFTQVLLDEINLASSDTLQVGLVMLRKRARSVVLPYAMPFRASAHCCAS